MLSFNLVRCIAAALFVSGLYVWHVVDKREAINTAIELVQGSHAALALTASEANRKREQELTLSIEKVRNDYAKQKILNAALVRSGAERLREYEAASTVLSGSSRDASTSSGAYGPFAGIASECTRSLVALDEHAQGLRATASALQNFAATVRLKSP